MNTSHYNATSKHHQEAVSSSIVPSFTLGIALGGLFGYRTYTTHYTLHTTHYTLHSTHYTLHTTHYTLHMHYTCTTQWQYYNIEIHMCMYFLLTNRGWEKGLYTAHKVGGVQEWSQGAREDGCLQGLGVSKERGLTPVVPTEEGQFTREIQCLDIWRVKLWTLNLFMNVETEVALHHVNNKHLFNN